ncbi:MAG TPA: ClcB-like voltage-gated chloride channel protein [Opitutaceae bacterium]|nr:ClcB-like voltage-gated chloride channel protein [Opitutaceae bacterium]
MKTASAAAPEFLRRLVRLLRWRLWIAEKLHPTEWQTTLLWAGLAGFLGALVSLLFSGLAEGIHEFLTGSSAGVVESMRQLPWWACIAVPATGGLLAGLVLQFGKKLTRSQSSTDYMEAIVIGTGHLPVRASLVKSTAALFSIGSGGSIGREGPMVQLAAMVASYLGRLQQFTPPQLRLLVACGAAAGIASAYNAPIAGSFFVAEIILGTIAMESLGPLAVSAVVAALTVRALTNAAQLYHVPAFRLNSPWEMGPYIVLGLTTGVVAPWFLRSLRAAERAFVATRLPLVVRLVIGGALVGVLAIRVPEVCGNGYSVVVDILNGNLSNLVFGLGLPSHHLAWVALALVFVCKWIATAASFGSGAPGGVFTPSLFMGASVGYLFGTAVNAVWPAGAPDPGAFALVGMGAFLSAASRAPVMAVIMLFEMTLSYDIVLPLLLCSVLAYYTAKGIEEQSLYSESLQRKSAEQPAAALPARRVAELMKADPPVLPVAARFAEIAERFLAVRVNNLYVVDEAGRFLGVVSLHDIKPYLGEPEVAELVLARDILHEDFPRLSPDQSLSEALGGFLGIAAERLPVVEPGGRLIGSLAKGDLLLTLVEKRKTPVPGGTAA